MKQKLLNLLLTKFKKKLAKKIVQFTYFNLMKILKKAWMIIN